MLRGAGVFRDRSSAASRVQSCRQSDVYQVPAVNISMRCTVITLFLVSIAISASAIDLRCPDGNTVNVGALNCTSVVEFLDEQNMHDSLVGVQCLVAPCSVSQEKCGKGCVDDYCGGCNARCICSSNDDCPVGSCT